jgi:hypothetical protein
MVRERIRATIAGVALLGAATVDGRAGDVPAKAVPPPYAFSDELGGFSIITITGIGTRDDPVHIVQRFGTAGPATLVIRATRPINPFGHPADYSTGTIHMVLDVTNDSGVPWIGFELELQEHFEKPSVFGDGLSFDQRQFDQETASSNAFANAHYDFEPFDRLLFEDGFVDPRKTAQFRFLITDLTPAQTFYVRLDPRIPAS